MILNVSESTDGWMLFMGKPLQGAYRINSDGYIERAISHREIKPLKSGGSLKRVNLSTEDGNRIFRVDKLVLNAFNAFSEEDYDPECRVAYRDGNLENTRIDNLFQPAMMDIPEGFEIPFEEEREWGGHCKYGHLLKNPNLIYFKNSNTRGCKTCSLVNSWSRKKDKNREEIEKKRDMTYREILNRGDCLIK